MREAALSGRTVHVYVLSLRGLPAPWSPSLCLPSSPPPHCLPPSSFLLFIPPALCLPIFHIPLSPTLSCLVTDFLIAISCPLSCILPSISSFLLSLSLFQIGEERATAISLMRKFIAYQFTDTVSVGRQLWGAVDRPKSRGRESTGSRIPLPVKWGASARKHSLD